MGDWEEAESAEEFHRRGAETRSTAEKILFLAVSKVLSTVRETVSLNGITGTILESSDTLAAKMA
jgi:hypothetical protein